MSKFYQEEQKAIWEGKCKEIYDEETGKSYLELKTPKELEMSFEEYINAL